MLQIAHHFCATFQSSEGEGVGMGHVLRMEPKAHARTVLTWTPEVEEKGGVHKQLREKLRTIREEMKSACIDWESATGLTRGRRKRGRLRKT